MSTITVQCCECGKDNTITVPRLVGGAFRCACGVRQFINPNDYLLSGAALNRMWIV